MYRGAWPNWEFAHPFPESYFGKYIFADYAIRNLYAVPLPVTGTNTDVPTFPIDNPEVLLLAQRAPVALCDGPDGSVWYANQVGEIRRIMYVSGNRPPTIVGVAIEASSGSPPVSADVAADSVSGPPPLTMTLVR